MPPKTATDRITKFDIQMFYDESRKPIYLGSKGQRSRSQINRRGP